MPRNMVSGKPSNQSARQVDIPPTTRLIWFFSRTDLWEYVLWGRQEYGFCSRATDVCPAQLVCVQSYSRLWWTCSTIRNERQTVASEQSVDVPSVCVRFTLQGWIRFRIVRLSWGLRLLIPFTTWSNKSNYMVIKEDVWPKILPCLNSYRCLSRMDNHIEFES
jgi:hypothetical protein